MAMRRFLTFRDFDWTLLAVVLLICALSVLEIYSATLHTKYVGFHTKQMLYIAGGLAAMFILAKIDYHRMLDLVPWFYGVFLFFLAAVLIPGIGHKALGARRCRHPRQREGPRRVRWPHSRPRRCPASRPWP